MTKLDMWRTSEDLWHLWRSRYPYVIHQTNKYILSRHPLSTTTYKVKLAEQNIRVPQVTYSKEIKR